MANYKSLKTCVVPKCPSSSEKTQGKLFLTVPTDKKNNYKKRKKWFEAMGRSFGDYRPDSVRYICVDHFDLEEDLLNYSFAKFKNFDCPLKLKEGVVPRRFDCQKDSLRDQSGEFLDESVETSVSGVDIASNTLTNLMDASVDSPSSNQQASTLQGAPWIVFPQPSIYVLMPVYMETANSGQSNYPSLGEQTLVLSNSSIIQTPSNESIANKDFSGVMRSLAKEQQQEAVHDIQSPRIMTEHHIPMIIPSFSSCRQPQMEETGSNVSITNVKITKKCIVSDCKSSSIQEPDKKFLIAPKKNTTKRRKWMEALGIEAFTTVSSDSYEFICEDHFNLEEDVADCEYRKTRNVKHVKFLLKLKDHVVPHRNLPKKNSSIHKVKAGCLDEEGMESPTIGMDSTGQSSVEEASFLESKFLVTNNNMDHDDLATNVAELTSAISIEKVTRKVSDDSNTQPFQNTDSKSLGKIKALAKSNSSQLSYQRRNHGNSINIDEFEYPDILLSPMTNDLLLKLGAIVRKKETNFNSVIEHPKKRHQVQLFVLNPTKPVLAMAFLGETDIVVFQGKEVMEPLHKWTVMPPLRLDSSIKSLYWNANGTVLAVVCFSSRLAFIYPSAEKQFYVALKQTIQLGNQFDAIGEFVWNPYDVNVFATLLSHEIKIWRIEPRLWKLECLQTFEGVETLDSLVPFGEKHKLVWMSEDHLAFISKDGNIRVHRIQSRNTYQILDDQIKEALHQWLLFEVWWVGELDLLVAKVGYVLKFWATDKIKDPWQIFPVTIPGLQMDGGQDDDQVTCFDAYQKKTKYDMGNSLSWSPPVMFSCGLKSGDVVIWTADVTEEITQFRAIAGRHMDTVNFVSFSPDGMKLVSWSEDEEIFVRSTQTWEIIFKSTLKRRLSCQLQWSAGGMVLFPCKFSPLESDVDDINGIEFIELSASIEDVEILDVSDARLP